MSNTIKAKFVAASVLDNQYESGKKDVTLLAVTDGSEENKAYWAATPAGSINLSVLNPEAEFEAGAEYYVEFTKVEKTEEQNTEKPVGGETLSPEELGGTENQGEPNAENLQQ